MNKDFRIIRQLRVIGLIEGVSYIVLLFISMPIKYLFKMPMPVLINGYIHGFLFIVLAITIVVAWVVRKWKFKRALIAGIASLIPFGTFWFDSTLREEEKLILQKTN
jgi:integral membrane protein